MNSEWYQKAELLIFVFFFGVVLLISKMRGSSRLWFRSIIPAWRFFDKNEEIPSLWLRKQKGPKSEPKPKGEWLRVESTFRLRWIHFFLNPNGNSLYANQSLLKLYLSDPTDETVCKALGAAANQIGRKLNSSDHSDQEFDFKVTLNNEGGERE